MIMVKKWFSIKNTVTTINTSVSKVTKQLTGVMTLLNTLEEQKQHISMIVKKII